MSQRQQNLTNPESVGLTFDDLHGYRYVQPILDKFAELIRDNPNMTWDDPQFIEARNVIFDGMDKREKTAYILTFGYPNFEVSEQGSSAANTSDVEAVMITYFEKFIRCAAHYASIGKTSVLFDNEEMSDEYIQNRYHRPFLQQEGANIVFANPGFPEETKGVDIESEGDAESALENAVHSHIADTVLSVLKKTEIQEYFTRGVFSFLEGKGIILPPEGETDIAEPDFKFKPKYHRRGGKFLDGGGLHVKPDLVVCYEAYLDGERYGVLGVTALGEVKRPSIKRYFGLMQKSLRKRDQPFLDAVVARTTRGAVFPTRLGKDLRQAVELYAIITKLVTSAVHMGEPRVLLTDAIDFLIIELDENFELERPIPSSPHFPTLVKSHHRWLNKSAAFLRLTLTGYFSPTQEYLGTLARFREPVQIHLEESMAELIRSVQRNMGRNPSRMDTTESTFENRRSMGSTARNRERKIGSETLSAMRAKEVKAILESMGHANTGQVNATKHKQQSDSSFGAESSNDSVFSEYATSSGITVPSAPTSAGTTVPSAPPSAGTTVPSGPPSAGTTVPSAPTSADIEGKMMYPEEYRDKFFLTTDGVKFFDDRPFHVRADTFKYPFYVYLAEAVKKYVRSDRGLISQVSLVNSDVFLANIPQPFMFNNAPQANLAILKVYDPSWYNNGRYDDPEVAFNEHGPLLEGLCKNELVIYEKLVPLMGEVVPLIYSYGYIIDASIMLNQLYKKFIGPYILMQPIERSKRFKESDVDLEFVQTRIIPQFKRLHELEVVHNDFKWENMLVTEDREVKIIDFSHSFISSDERDYKEELDNIYGYFGFSNPGSV